MKSYKKTLGVVLILIGLILNPFIIKATIISDISFFKSKISGIILFELILILTGIYLLNAKKISFLSKFFRSELAKNIFITISTFLIIILLMEAFTYFLNGPDKDKKIFLTNRTSAYGKACINGNTPAGLTVNDIMMLSNGSTVYNYTYTTDQYKRRISPLNQNNPHLMLFGGSFTFGVGLEDNQTLSYLLSQQTDYNILNYAYKGFGPNHMLAYLEEDNFGEDITNKNGIAIYVFIEHHVRRAYGEMLRYANQPLYTMPYYSIDEDKNIERVDCFATQNKLKIFTYKLLSKSNTLKFFKINPPIKNRDSVYLTFKIIEKSKQIYESKFNGTFYVLMHPLDEQGILKPDEKRYFMDLLQQENVTVLQYPIENKGNYRIEWDNHPNKEYNTILAELLARDLNSGRIKIG